MPLSSMKNENFCGGIKPGMEAVISDKSQCGNPQSDKFKEAARELGCDEDEARWDERLRKVASARAAPHLRDEPENREAS